MLPLCLLLQSFKFLSHNDLLFAELVCAEARLSVEAHWRWLAERWLLCRPPDLISNFMPLQNSHVQQQCKGKLSTPLLAVVLMQPRRVFRRGCLMGVGRKGPAVCSNELPSDCHICDACSVGILAARLRYAVQMHSAVPWHIDLDVLAVLHTLRANYVPSLQLSLELVACSEQLLELRNAGSFDVMGRIIARRIS